MSGGCWGGIEINANAEISGGGRLTVVRDPAVEPDWLSDRLRVWWMIGDEYSWPMGTFIPSAPTASYSFIEEDGLDAESRGSDAGLLADQA